MRKHLPSGYTDYRKYKPWLRDEFVFRCVFCLEREMWALDRHNSFSVEHVIPQRGPMGDSTKVCDYTNLVYACTRCNSFKQDTILLDPCAINLSNHLTVDCDGKVHASTREGKRLIQLLHLNEKRVQDNRKYFLDLIALKREYPDDPTVDRMFLMRFGYPNDMPDLRRSKRKKNARQGSEQNCYFARNERNELPQFY